jgi:hypothetical protein
LQLALLVADLLLTGERFNRNVRIAHNASPLLSAPPFLSQKCTTEKELLRVCE